MQRACHPNLAPEQPTDSALAPVWHTQLVVLLLLVVPATGLMLGPAAASDLNVSRIAALYAPLLLVNVAFAGYVTRIGLGRSIFWELLGERREASRLARDLLWGTALGLLLLGAENLLQTLPAAADSVAAHALVASSRAEKACWLLVAASVGISEELVYRGYLQRQFAALSGHAAFGILAQALLFGIAHGEQGAWTVARFACYGLAFGWVAERRRSLVPGMLCHVALDMYAGLGG